MEAARKFFFKGAPGEDAGATEVREQLEELRRERRASLGLGSEALGRAGPIRLKYFEPGGSSLSREHSRER